MEVNILVGQTISAIERTFDELTFAMSDGRVYRFAHEQDCCECVEIHDVIGDFDDLIDSPLTQAEVACNIDSHPEGVQLEYEPDSFTWTFYKFATNKGSVTVRWLGSSNGYYSEEVNFFQVGG